LRSGTEVYLLLDYREVRQLEKSKSGKLECRVLS